MATAMRGLVNEPKGFEPITFREARALPHQVTTTHLQAVRPVTISLVVTGATATRATKTQKSRHRRMIGFEKEEEAVGENTEEAKCKLVAFTITSNRCRNLPRKNILVVVMAKLSSNIRMLSTSLNGRSLCKAAFWRLKSSRQLSLSRAINAHHCMHAYSLLSLTPFRHLLHFIISSAYRHTMTLDFLLFVLLSIIVRFATTDERMNARAQKKQKRKYKKCMINN